MVGDRRLPMLTDSAIQELLELEARASEGPWEVLTLPDDPHGEHGRYALACQSDHSRFLKLDPSAPWLPHAIPNVTFIAALRNAARDLIDEVVAARAVSEQPQTTR
jgi:hypothetical protein